MKTLRSKVGITGMISRLNFALIRVRTIGVIEYNTYTNLFYNNTKK